MEKIGNLIKRDQPALKSQDSTTTLQKSSAPSAPQWITLLLQMAQDKRHDLAPGILLYWKAKLQKYGDIEISQALMTSGWEFFPSVDNVISLIEANRSAASEAKGDVEWQQWKQRQKDAEEKGLLATDKQYSELRQTFEKAAKGEFGTVKPKPRQWRERNSDCVAETPSPAD